jgi:hypothetical protein
MLGCHVVIMGAGFIRPVLPGGVHQRDWVSSSWGWRSFCWRSQTSHRIDMGDELPIHAMATCSRLSRVDPTYGSQGWIEAPWVVLIDRCGREMDHHGE